MTLLYKWVMAFNNTEKRLMTIKEFREKEPALGDEQAIRRRVREGFLRSCTVQIGGRYFIDMERWEQVKADCLLSTSAKDAA